MMHCCGKEVSTSFCPSCGADLRHPLGDLLAYVKSSTERARAGYARRVVESGENPEDGYSLRQKERGHNSLLKWERWCDGLVALMFPPDESKG